MSNTATFSIKYEARPQVTMELGTKRKGHVTDGAIDNRPSSWAELYSWLLEMLFVGWSPKFISRYYTDLNNHK